MSWGPGDYALIITTVTTAASAFAGFVLPLIKSHSDEKARQKADDLSTFRDALQYCVVHSNDVILNNRLRSMNMAYYEAKLTVGSPDDALSDIDQYYLRNFALVKFICTEKSIDCEAFSRAVLGLRGTFPKFEIVDGTAVVAEADRPKEREIFLFNDLVTDEGAKLLVNFKRKLSIA